MYAQSLFPQCSKTCGEGIKRRVVMCQDVNENQSSQCDDEKRPQDQMTCNTDPCPIWNFGGWGQVINYVYEQFTGSTTHDIPGYFRYASCFEEIS